MKKIHSKSEILTSAFYGLIILSQALLFQQAAKAEAPLSEATEPLMIEGRAHYSFTLPHTNSVQSGSSQAVWMEYNRPDIVGSESAVAAPQETVTDISQETVVETVEKIRETTLASDS